MSSSDETRAGFGNPIINLILTALVFLFWAWILRPYVPAKTELNQWILASFAGIALTVTFYFALNMFRVTLNDHKQRENQ